MRSLRPRQKYGLLVNEAKPVGTKGWGEGDGATEVVLVCQHIPQCSKACGDVFQSQGLIYPSSYGPPYPGTCGVGKGVQRGGVKFFFGLLGDFSIPYFILSILNIHNLGSIFFYHSSEMKNRSVFRQTHN